MRTFLRRYKILLLVLCLVLFGLHLFSTSLEEPRNVGVFGRAVLNVYEPIHKVLNFPFQKLSFLFGRYLLLVDLKQENSVLSGRNAELQAKVNELSEQAVATERIQALLELKEHSTQRVTFARVIVRPQGGEFGVLIVDKGIKDGVEVEMVAIAPQGEVWEDNRPSPGRGLVGHVIQTASYASKVLLITDATSSVPAMVQRTRAEAIVQGRSRSLCRLKFLQRVEDIAEGDVVVTSGLGGLFPQGLLIGTVVRVEKEDWGIFQDALLDPIVDMNTIEEIALISKSERSQKAFSDADKLLKEAVKD